MNIATQFYEMVGGGFKIINILSTVTIYEKAFVSNVFYKICNTEAATRGVACNFIEKETLAQVFFCEFC